MRALRLVIAAVALAALAFFAWRALAPHAEPQETATASSAPVDDETDALSPPLSADTRAVVAPAVEPAAPDSPPASASNDLPPGDPGDATPTVLAPPGTLEVQAESRDGRLQGVTVEIWDSTLEIPPDRPAHEAHGWRSSRTDASGLARFTDVAPAEYAIRATFARGVVVTRRVHVFEGAPTPRIHVRLGKATIYGRVFAPDGSLAARALVRMVQDTELREARADANGDYRFDDVRERSTRITAALAVPAGVQPSPLQAGRARLVPRIGESRRIDFGSAEPPCKWSGNVHAADGVLLRWSLPIEFDEVAHGNLFSASSSASGQFTVEVPAGEYRASIVIGARNVEVGRVKVGAPALVHDLTIPGACVWGTLHYVGSRASTPAPRPPTLLVRRREPPDERTFSARVSRTEYLIPALEPGVYAITAAADSVIADAPADGIVLDLREKRGLVVQDLVIGDP